MKNTLILSAFALLAFLACGPAAEDRVKMDENARIMSDTIKANIEQTIDKVMQEVNQPSGVVFISPTAAATASTSTTQPKK